jgi:hypothetical protein
MASKKKRSVAIGAFDDENFEVPRGRKKKISEKIITHSLASESVSAIGLDNTSKLLNQNPIVSESNFKDRAIDEVYNSSTTSLYSKPSKASSVISNAIKGTRFILFFREKGSPWSFVRMTGRDEITGYIETRFLQKGD